MQEVLAVQENLANLIIGIVPLIVAIAIIGFILSFFYTMIDSISSKVLPEEKESKTITGDFIAVWKIILDPKN